MARPKANLPELLRRLGETIYGRGWETALARDLGLHRTTVERWARGKSNLQDYYIDQILQCSMWRLRANRQRARWIIQTIKNLPESERYGGDLKLPEPIYIPPWRKLEKFVGSLEDF